MFTAKKTTEPFYPSRERTPKPERFSLFIWLRQSFQANPWLTTTGLLMLITLGASGVGLLIDHRMIAGAPAWAKPAKFAISFSVYSFTLIWLLTLLQRWRKTVAAITSATTIFVLLEMSLIVLQVIRGVRSHFNNATPFDALVTRAMSLGVVLFVVAFLATAVLLLCVRHREPALIWSVRLGLLIMAFGLFVGFLMTQATPAQMAVYHATGQFPAVIGAHSVGVPDGGPALPFLGWSTTGGDLRIAHFVGIHALQVLLFLGWLLSAQHFPWLSTRERVALVWTMSLGYLGLDASLLWQALRGQPLIAPDGLTWLTWGLVVGLTLLISGAIMLRASHRSVQ